MTSERIKRILDAHSIRYQEEGGRIYAAEVYTINGQGYEEPREVTAWTLKELKSWLGY